MKDYTVLEVFEEGSCIPTHYAGGRNVFLRIDNQGLGTTFPILISQAEGKIQVFATINKIAIDVEG